jgi:hypothetical protein
VTTQDDDTPAEASDDAEVRGEKRGPVVTAVLVTMVLPFLLPHDLVPGPRWILPAAEGVLLVAMAVTDPGRIDRRSNQVRAVRIALIGFLVMGTTWGTARLIYDLIEGSSVTNSANALLAAGAVVWLYLVITFGFVFWELDAGGPGQRAHAMKRFPDLAFPQHMNPDVAPPGWRPVFVDYVYLSFTASLAFSPTDVMPLAHWAKLAMAVESLTSLAILGLVIARAVNVFT